MTKVSVKYIGHHQVKGVIEIEKEIADTLIKSGECVLADSEESTSVKKTYSEKEIIDMNKDEQIIIIRSYGVYDIPKYEKDRVKKILELQEG